MQRNSFHLTLRSDVSKTNLSETSGKLVIASFDDFTFTLYTIESCCHLHRRIQLRLLRITVVVAGSTRSGGGRIRWHECDYGFLALAFGRALVLVSANKFSCLRVVRALAKRVE
jgi:hypothetical protein